MTLTFRENTCKLCHLGIGWEAHGNQHFHPKCYSYYRKEYNYLRYRSEEAPSEELRTLAIDRARDRYYEDRSRSSL